MKVARHKRSVVDNLVHVVRSVYYARYTANEEEEKTSHKVGNKPLITLKAYVGYFCPPIEKGVSNFWVFRFYGVFKRCSNSKGGYHAWNSHTKSEKGMYKFVIVGYSGFRKLVVKTYREGKDKEEYKHKPRSTIRIEFAITCDYLRKDCVKHYISWQKPEVNYWVSKRPEEGSGKRWIYLLNKTKGKRKELEENFNNHWHHHYYPHDVVY